MFKNIQKWLNDLKEFLSADWEFKAHLRDLETSQDIYEVEQKMARYDRRHHTNFNRNFR